MAMEDEEAPASSLQPVHKLSRPDPLHGLQSLRDLAIINERTEREFGPRPKHTVPPERKRKPRIERTYDYVPDVKEVSDMMTKDFAMVAALGVITAQPVTAIGSEAVSEVAIPADVISLVKPNREVLAYRSIETNDVGDKLVVLVTRWQTAGPVSAKAKSEWDVEYACELALFESKRGSLTAVARNQKVVDCEYNHINRAANMLQLNGKLKVSQKKLTFVNDNVRGGSYSYSFELKDGMWHASEAVSYYVDHEASEDADEVVVAREQASYPKDFGYISLDEFDPGDIEEILSRNKSIDWEEKGER